MLLLLTIELGIEISATACSVGCPTMNSELFAGLKARAVPPPVNDDTPNWPSGTRKAPTYWKLLWFNRGKLSRAEPLGWVFEVVENCDVNVLARALPARSLTPLLPPTTSTV